MGLVEELDALGIASETALALAALVDSPPEGVFEGQDSARGSPAGRILLAALLASYEFRRFGHALPALASQLAARERDLVPFDRARARHVRALAIWRVGGSFFSAGRLLNASIRLLANEGTVPARTYLARVHDTFGQMLRQRGALGEARRELETALKLREQAGDDHGRAITLGNLGRLCMDLGDFSAAERCFADDLVLVERLTPERVALRAQLLSHAAQCALSSGDVERAASRFERSTALAREASDAGGLLFAEIGQGRVALSRGDAEGASSRAEGVLRELDQLALASSFARELRGGARHLLADAQQARAEGVAAIANYELAAEELGGAPGASLVDQAQVLRGLSRAHALEGEPVPSARRLRQALRLLDATAAHELRASVEAELRAQSPDAWLLHAAGRFVGHGPLDRLLDDAGREGFRGEHREVVVLFSDIRGFTTLSERLEPDALVAFLNEFLTRMTWCIEEHGGSVDKFIGDAVMAVFPAEGGSDAALEAAVAMRDELERFNRRTEGSAPLAIGVGLNAGRVVSGLIGSPQKREHTVLGDVVNTASRLEGMTKQLGASILVSEAVVRRLRHADRWLLLALGRFAPKGRRGGVSVFDVLGERDETEASASAQEDIAATVSALARLGGRQFEEAASAFADLRRRTEGTPRAHGYALLEHAALQFRSSPPPPEWLGEVALSEK